MLILQDESMHAFMKEDRRVKMNGTNEHLGTLGSVVHGIKEKVQTKDFEEFQKCLYLSLAK